MLVLRAAVGGREFTLELVDPLAVEGISQPRECDAGAESATFFSVTGGQAPYTYTDARGMQSISIASGASHRHEYTCPATAGAHTLLITVTDAATRQASGTVDLSAAVALAAPTNLRTSNQTQISARLHWDAVDGATSYVVRRGPAGGPEYSTTATSYYLWLANTATAYNFNVRAHRGAGCSPWVKRRQTTAAAQLSLSASANPAGCVTGGSVSVSWTVSGGTSPYRVTVNGAAANASPVQVTCQSTAGTQSIVVRAADASSPALSAAETLSITVTDSPPQLELTVTPLDRHCVIHQRNIEIAWSVSGGTPPYTVTVGGQASTGGSHQLNCGTTASTTVTTVQASDSGSPPQRAAEHVTLTATAPLVLGAAASPSSCTTGDTVQIIWVALGGTAPHTVAVDNARAAASPTTVRCQSTAGAQQVELTATDSSTPQLSADKSVTLSVSAPDPLTLATFATPTTCEEGGSVSVYWIVVGGTSPHTVTIDGVRASASPTLVECTPPTGSQSILVRAVDSSPAPLKRHS